MLFLHYAVFLWKQKTRKLRTKCILEITINISKKKKLEGGCFLSVASLMILTFKATQHIGRELVLIFFNQKFTEFNFIFHNLPIEV